jgi:hypothetical protein
VADRLDPPLVTLGKQSRDIVRVGRSRIEAQRVLELDGRAREVAGIEQLAAFRDVLGRGRRRILAGAAEQRDGEQRDDRAQDRGLEVCAHRHSTVAVVVGQILRVGAIQHGPEQWLAPDELECAAQVTLRGLAIAR